jgi:hypothetical protein
LAAGEGRGALTMRLSTRYGWVMVAGLAVWYLALWWIVRRNDGGAR